jgi:crotonobetainyl-CoA:carnitine CoA-transferase CaiB-like acyl-CoA transferase
MTMKEAIAHRPPLPGMSILGRLRDGIHRRRDHVVAREVVEVPDFLAGTIAVSGDFWHFSRTPAVVGSTPKVGEHNEEVLGGLLGYSEDEIATLSGYQLADQ